MAGIHGPPPPPINQWRRIPDRHTAKSTQIQRGNAAVLQVLSRVILRVVARRSEAFSPIHIYVWVALRFKGWFG